MTPYFKYAATNKDNQYLYIDPATNTVKTTTQLTFLRYEPEDFNSNFQVTAKRDLLGTGIFLNYTLPIEYVKDMKMIMQYLLYTEGYTAQLKFIVYKKDHTTQQYIKYVVGDVDFTQFEDDKTKQAVKVNLLDNSINGLLKTNDNTVYDVPLSHAKAITMKMDGIELKNHATWVVINSIHSGDNPALGHILYLELAAVEGQNKLDVYTRDWFKFNNFNTQVAGQPHHFYYASASRDIIISYDFTVDLSDGSGVSADFSTTSVKISIIRRRGGVTTEEHILFSESNFNIYFNNTFHLQNTVTLNAQIGDEFYLSASSNGGTSVNLINWMYGGNGYFDLRFYSRYPQTDVKAFRIIDLLNILLSNATGGKCIAQSSYLTNPNLPAHDDHIDNIPYNTLITSGDGIRGLSGAAVKTSINKIIQFLTNRYCIGRQLVGNVLKIEPLRQQFAAGSTSVTFNDVNGFNVSVAQDLIFSGVKAGYIPQNSEILNGKDEFNASIEMTFPTGIAGTGTLNLISDGVRADIYGIEAIRQETHDTDTTDNKSDSGVFAVEVEGAPDGSGKFAIIRRAGVNAGVNSPVTVYNQGLSPKRCIIANMPKIGGCLHDPGKGVLKFTSTLGNPNFRTSLGFGSYPATLVIETQDIDLTNGIFLGKPLYRPYYFTFNAIHKEDILPAILANPYGEVSFKNPYNGQYYRGFIVELACILSKRDVYKVKLIASPDTDMTTLTDKT